MIIPPRPPIALNTHSKRLADSILVDVIFPRVTQRYPIVLYLQMDGTYLANCRRPVADKEKLKFMRAVRGWHRSRDANKG